MRTLHWRSVRHWLLAGVLAMLAPATAVRATASTVVIWGATDYGKTNVPGGLSNAVAIAAGDDHGLALRADGRVAAWGLNNYGQTNVPTGLSNVVAIAGGMDHSLALTVDGRVVAWGLNRYGQASAPAGLSNAIGIAAGWSHSLALTGEGRVVAWGANGYPQASVPSWLSNVVAVAAGGDHSMALTAEGRVVAWGHNDYRQTNVPAGLSNVVAVEAGLDHSLALTAEGRVIGWGRNQYGQTNIPSGLSNVVGIAAGGYHNLALTAEGRVVGWGGSDHGQANVPGWVSNVVSIAAGYTYSIALENDRCPVITASPPSQAAIAGQAVSFRVWAAGMQPLFYQWQKAGSDLPGQTKPELRLANITAGASGGYAAVVSNAAGLATASLVATLTVNCLLSNVPTAGGAVTREPDLPYYEAGSSVTLTAAPDLGYAFIRWVGDAACCDNPLAVVMETNKSIKAVFASTVLTLASQGVGTVTKFPDQPFYSLGEQVTLSATAGRWHVFSGWADGVASNPRAVIIGESNAYTAVFTPTRPLETLTIGGVSRLAPVGMPAVVVDGVFILTPSASARGSAQVTLFTTFPNDTILYTLDGSEPTFAAPLYTGPLALQSTCVLRAVAYNADFTQAVPGDPVTIKILPSLAAVVDGGGSIAVEPPTGDYFSNSLALVTATPLPGWTFLQWLGDATGTNPVASLTMTRSKSVRAVFGTTLNTAVGGSGSIVVSPVSCLYPYGSGVRLTPLPAAGNYHALWANAAAGRTNNPLMFTLTNANPIVSAVFASLGSAQTNALTVIPDGRGHVELTPPGNRYRLNTNVVLRAIAEAGQEFLGWSGAASGNQNPLTVTVNSNKVITANFTKRPWLAGEGNPGLLDQDGLRLTLTGEFGAVYQVLSSLDFVTWTPLAKVTNTWGTVQTADATATNAPGRFYRARAVE